MNMIHFGHTLCRLRTMNDCTQQILAEHLNMTRQGYRRHELTPHCPSYEFMIKLLQFYRMTPDDYVRSVSSSSELPDSCQSCSGHQICSLGQSCDSLKLYSCTGIDTSSTSEPPKILVSVLQEELLLLQHYRNAPPEEQRILLRLLRDLNR